MHLAFINAVQVILIKQSTDSNKETVYVITSDKIL